MILLFNPMACANLPIVSNSLRDFLISLPASLFFRVKCRKAEANCSGDPSFSKQKKRLATTCSLMNWDNVGNVKNRSKQVTRDRFWDAYLTLGWPYIRIQMSQIQKSCRVYPDLDTLALGPHHIVRGTVADFVSVLVHVYRLRRGRTAADGQ